MNPMLNLLLAFLALGVLLPVPMQAQTTPPSGALPPQMLRPGDVVRLAIWREPDFSGDFTVDRSGVIVFPRLGEVRVVDLGPAELETTLLEQYRRYLVNPSIEITILRRVNVMGAVQRPGLYPVDPTVTIADVLALAGGSTPIGDPSKIRLIRDGETISTTLGEGTRIGESPIRSGDQIFVPERNWITRNAGVVAASISAVVTLIVAFTR